MIFVKSVQRAIALDKLLAWARRIAEPNTRVSSSYTLRNRSKDGSSMHASRQLKVNDVISKTEVVLD